MTTLPQHGLSGRKENQPTGESSSNSPEKREDAVRFRLAVEPNGAERREHRRYDLCGQTLTVARWDTNRRSAGELGYIMDVSAGGVRIRTAKPVKPDSQIRVRLEMPSYAGICPFVDTHNSQPRPKNDWVGWLAISRVEKSEGNSYDVAGRLVDMDEMDRGMLGLYLSTQPIAA